MRNDRERRPTRAGRLRASAGTGPARWAASLLVLACLAAACAPTGTPAPSASGGTPAPSAGPSAAPSAGAGPTPTSTIPVPPTGTPTARPSPGRPELGDVRIALEPVGAGLDHPLFVTGAGDGSGRLFVVEQGGRIRIVRDGSVLPVPFLDIADRVSAGGERGLLGLAFAPGFGTDRLGFFVHYSAPDGATTIAEFGVPDAGSDVADPRSGRVLLSVPQPYANHNGGWIGFDPGGMLLVALGDGGSGGDPENRAGRLDNLLGKMLRLDVLHEGGAAYAVPPDNPFVGQGGALPEILHSGLRNPWRASFDDATGDLWIGDVGQGAWEEVDVARAGASGLDFGWRRWEGRHCYRPSSGCDPTGVTQPVAEYPHALGCSIAGGYVYRGDAIRPLRGAYLFGDYCSGTIWAIDAGLDALQAPLTLLETGRTISSFGRDDAGELYLTDLAAGEVLRIVAAP